MTDHSDAELLGRSADSAAFTELYRRHVDTVFAWFRRRLDWGAADLTAETFAQAWISRRRFARAAAGCRARPSTPTSPVTVVAFSVLRSPSAPRRQLATWEGGS